MCRTRFVHASFNRINLSINYNSQPENVDLQLFDELPHQKKKRYIAAEEFEIEIILSCFTFITSTLIA